MTIDGKKKSNIHKSIILVLILFLFTVGVVFQINRKVRQQKTDVIAWFEEDHRLFAIAKSNADGDMKLDTGEKYGSIIKVYSDYEILQDKPVFHSEPDFQIDLSEIKPLKILMGDIDGDGVKEAGICVYKTTKFHPVPAKRPFFYRLNEGTPEPVWLGSRLARPFDDYILFDVDQDNIDEIISIETMENGNKVIAIYDWRGFGFEVKTVSEELEGTVVFLNNLHQKDSDVVVAIADKQYEIRLEKDQIKLKTHQEGDK